MDNPIKLFNKIAIPHAARSLSTGSLQEGSPVAAKNCGSPPLRTSEMGNDFFDLARLIRSLQRLEGNPECFGTAGNSCEQPLCAWRDYCLKPAGEPVHYPEEGSEKIHE
jgi:hypothetical protein